MSIASIRRDLEKALDRLTGHIERKTAEAEGHATVAATAAANQAAAQREVDVAEKLHAAVTTATANH